MIKNVEKRIEMCSVGALLYAAHQVYMFFASSGKHQYD